jgi:predicted nucleic acid-binding protein
MFLLDTSVIVSALVEEERTSLVQDWLAERAGKLPLSTWAMTEFSSALALKRRMEKLSEGDRQATLRLFADFTEYELEVIEVEREDFKKAARLCDNWSLGLRAADALHLAVALRNSRTLVTLDQRLAVAARHLGCDVIIP